MKNRNLQTKRMIKTFLFVLLFGMVGMTKSYAYDFYEACETGQILYYNITDATNHYVELTSPSVNWNGGYVRPTGNMVLPEYVYDANDNQFYVTSIGDGAFRFCSGLISVTIPNSVTSIGYAAFRDCSGLTSVSIPNSVTIIGEEAFMSCSGLTSVSIPNSVTIINDYAFWCSGLTSIEIPNSVTTIGFEAFSGCSGITSVTIPDSVTTIGSLAFSGTNLTSLTLGNSVTTIGSNAFAGCSGLIGDLTIPNSVNTIGTGAFSGCSYTSVTFGNCLTTIGLYAFSRCSGLTSVIIPNSVTTIGDGAFNGCSGLSSVVMLAVTPPTIGDQAFSGTSDSLLIYVPYESLSSYRRSNTNYYGFFRPMIHKTISGYGENTTNGQWAFVASPLIESTVPVTVDNMIAETAAEYDLYRFNQSSELEWENYKQEESDHYHFDLENGRGYLYANKEDVSLIFKGDFNESSMKTIYLVYEANEPLAGWNLVGNPFPVEAYVNKSYYAMNENGTNIDPVPFSNEIAIKPCTGIFVKVTSTGRSVTFSKMARREKEKQGFLQISVAQSNTRDNTSQDKAIVSFNEGDELGKFVFNKDNAKLYIPQGNEDYAIAYAEKQDEMPLNFEAKESGSYTISVNPESVEMNYLHLIDNMTGTDVDLLATPSYTFESKTSDYASRFRLVFSANGNTDNENEEPFAFISNGNIIVAGDYANATLQIVDMLGHVVVSTDVAHNVSTNGIASGVYVLRLINGNDVKTQKIVIR